MSEPLALSLGQLFVAGLGLSGVSIVVGTVVTTLVQRGVVRREAAIDDVAVLRAKVEGAEKRFDAAAQSVRDAAKELRDVVAEMVGLKVTVSVHADELSALKSWKDTAVAALARLESDVDALQRHRQRDDRQADVFRAELARRKGGE